MKVIKRQRGRAVSLPKYRCLCGGVVVADYPIKERARGRHDCLGLVCENGCDVLVVYEL